MAIVSEYKHYSLTKRKKNPSNLKAYTYSLEGHQLVTYLQEGFLFLYNTVTDTSKKLFPVDKLSYIDLEQLQDGAVVFIIKDKTGTSIQVRNFERGTLKYIPIEHDSESTPQIILTSGYEGVYYSREYDVIKVPLKGSEIETEEVIMRVEGEYLEYVAEENNSLKIVTKVKDPAKINPAFTSTILEAQEYTYIPVETNTSLTEVPKKEKAP